MDHIYKKHFECDERHCPICDGGLKHCTVCGGAENSLTEECCGRALTIMEEDQIMAAELDFKNGVWEVNPLDL